MAASSHLDRTVPLLTEREVAGVLRVSGRTVRRWAANGVLPVIQIGGVRRYSADYIEALIATPESEARGAQSAGFAKTAGEAAGDVGRA